MEENLCNLEVSKDVLDMTQKKMIHNRKKLRNWTLSKLKLLLFE